MRKRPFGVILAALVYFGWSALAWTVLGYHETAMKRLPEESVIMETLKFTVPESGVYVFPSERTDDGPEDSQAWRERYRSGPVGLLIYQEAGGDPMSPRRFGISLIVAGVVSLFCFVLLSLGGARLRGAAVRSMFLAATAVFVWVAAAIPNWNWFGFSGAYTITLLVDWVIGFMLVGLTLSPFLPSEKGA